MTTQPLSVAVAYWVRQALGSRGIRAQELAPHLGISAQQLSPKLKRATGDLSRPRFAIDDLHTFARFFDIDLDVMVAEMLELQKRGATWPARPPAVDRLEIPAP